MRIISTSLLTLIKVQFREFVREPEIVFWAVIFPIAIAWVLGIAFTQKPEITRTVAVVHGNYSNQTTLGTFLSGEMKPISLESPVSGKMTFQFLRTSTDSAILFLKRGKITAILQPGDQGNPVIHIDPASSEAQLTVYTLEEAIHQNQPRETDIQPLTLIGTRYVDFLIPGLIAFGIMNSALWGIGFGLIEYRMKKLLRRMLATPMKKHEFMISMLAARLVLSFLEVLILMFFAWMYFDLWPTGSLAALVVLFLLGNFAFTGLAILVSSRSDNTRVGVGFINAITMPMMIVSGIFFSYHNFPDVVVPFIQALPLTILADSIRAVFNEGSGLLDVWPAMVVLLSVGTVAALVGLKVYKWH